MQLVGPVDRPLSARIYATLREDIVAGRLRPGDAVPSERQLSDELGASRHAVREALKRLQEARLVRIAQGGATRVCDWRATGGLDLLLALGAEGLDPPEVGLRRAGLELRACIGADAARRCAQRASAVRRAELVAGAEALAAESDLDRRNAEYERLWGLIVEGADNIAYRLALNTLKSGQQVLAFDDARTVAGELADDAAIRALAAAIADGADGRAHETARELLERTIPGG